MASMIKPGSRLRVAVFGVGRMGRVHVEHVVRSSRNNTIELVAIGDRHLPCCLATLEWLNKVFEGNFAKPLLAASPEELIEVARPDAVVVASKIEDHLQDLIPFLASGIPVLVEKPMVHSLEQAIALYQRFGRKGIERIQIAFQRFEDPAMRQAIAWYESGFVGQLQQSRHVIQDKNPPPVGYESGGIASDMMVHLIFETLCFHRMELPLSIRAIRFLAPHYDDRANEHANVVHALCQWNDGSVAHLWGSRLNATGYDNGFTLIGTQGRIDVGDFVGNFGPVSARLWRGTDDVDKQRGHLADSRSFPMTKPIEGHPDFYPRYAQAFANELDRFLENVRNSQVPLLGFEVGWKTIFLANLAEESSLMDGKRIEIQERSSEYAQLQEFV